MIGIFDSGIGGLSVLAAIRKQMPWADMVYFGDTENAPYGEKSAREIGELISMALRRLAAEGATDIVSACNSASVSVHTVPIDLLREGKFNIVEMVGPTAAALSKLNKKIVLLGTTVTIRSGIYQKAFKAEGVTVETVAIPKLAGFIESGASVEELFAVVRPAVLDAVSKGAEVVSLSCTHYPFVKELFEHCLHEAGSAAAVFDPAVAVATEVAKRFPAPTPPEATEGHSNGTGTLRLLISKESSVFRAYAKQLFADTAYSVEVARPIYWALKTS